MFREMRRKKQALPDSEICAILDRATSGVLALCGDDGYPYAVPMSFVRDGETLYFHAARVGHKIDAINRDDRASFCVIGDDVVVPERFLTRYRSVIAFGRARIITGGDEYLRAIRLICGKYSPGLTQESEAEISDSAGRMCIIALDVEHITGKQALELSL